MTDREYEIHAHAAWAVSTIAAMEVLRRNKADGHAQQLEYVLMKFFKIAENKFGDDFLARFHKLFEETNGPITTEKSDMPENEETIH